MIRKFKKQPITLSTALLLSQSLIAAPTDVSNLLEYVGNPLVSAGVTGGNRSVTDMRYFHGRLFVSYGMTNNGSANKFLYADPVSKTVGEEAHPGINLELEVSSRFHVAANTLLLQADDWTGGTRGFFTRTAGGSWSLIVATGAEDHNRDAFRFGDRYWMSSGGGGYPRMLSARVGSPQSNLGRISNTAPSGYSDLSNFLASTYLTFRGRLYAVNANWPGSVAPFLLRLDGTSQSPLKWNVVRSDSGELFTAPDNVGLTYTISVGLATDTAEVTYAGQNRLIFPARKGSSNATSLFQISDLESGKATSITLPDALTNPAPSTMQLIHREGRVFAAVFQLNTAGTATTVQVHQLKTNEDPGLTSSWPAIFRFTSSEIFGRTGTYGHSFDYGGGRFHFIANTLYNPYQSKNVGSYDNIGKIYTLPFTALPALAKATPDLPDGTGRGSAALPASNPTVRRISATSNALAWGPIRNEAYGWKLERSVDGSPYSTVGIFAGEEVTWVDSSVPAGGQAAYRILGYTTAGFSAAVQFPVAGQAPSTYQDWQALTDWKAIPEDQRNPTDDPDGDGLNNATERAFGTNPVAPSASPSGKLLISLNPDGTRSLKTSFFKGAPERSYILQYSTTLGSWANMTTGSELYDETTGLHYRTWTAPVSEPRAFVRIQVSP